ncbi:hypothetical protein, partial [Ruminococcus albus]|uniref:hypothetical protein n=1 Tax=Ruminococcus albus TaxID=1264 RepID=UPI001A9A5D90
CALKQLISPVNMFFYSDVRIWFEGAAVATASFLYIIECDRVSIGLSTLCVSAQVFFGGSFWVITIRE